MWTLQYKGFFIVQWVLRLLCLFELRNFETIQYSLCHRKFSYMINQKFMKLCTLQDPNMKMCTFVVSRSIEFYPCYASLDLEILRQFSMHFVIANSPTWLIRISWNFVHYKILIWSSISWSIKFSQNYESKSCVPNMFWLN